MAVLQAKEQGMKNFSVLVSHVCVPPAMKAILGSPHNRVQGFLAGGACQRGDGLSRISADR